MKIKKDKPRNKKIVILIAVTTAIMLSIGAYLVYSYVKNSTDTPRDDSTSENRETDKDNTSDNGTPTKQTQDSPVAGEPDSTKPNNTIEPEPTTPIGGDATLSITELSQTNNTVRATAQFKNAPEGGRCIVYFTSVGGAISEYMTVAGTTCSLEMSALKFTYLGDWNARVTYTTPDNTIIEAKGMLTIK